MSRIFWVLRLLLLLLIPLPGLNFLNKTTFAAERSYQILGRVIDAETNTSIEFAYVSLYHLPDTTHAEITATNSKGEFAFGRLLPGDYSIRVHLIGFENYKTEPFSLSGKETVLRLKPIVLKTETMSLDEVTVVANAANPVYQIDKKTIYVENQLSATGGTSVDLLLKLPSLTQTPDGKIAIHGNSNLLVYINGRPSSLKGEELLQNIPADEVKKIELITSPSAKYDASGSGGIINLITKKSTLEGFDGNLMASFDHLGGYSSDILLNYKYRRFSFFTGMDHNKRKNKGNIDYQTDYLSDHSYFTKTGLLEAQRINTGFRSGVDYLPTASDKISLSGNAGRFETTNYGDWVTLTGNNNAPQSSPVRNTATDDNNRKGNYGGADLMFEHKFDSSNKIFNLSSTWNTANYDDSYLNLTNDVAGNERIRQLTRLDKTYHNFQFNADYSAPIGKAGNLEIGYQLALNNENETYHSELSNPAPPVITNQDVKFRGLIQAGYGTWQFKINRLDIKAGLRAENLNRELNTSGNSYTRDRFDLYPSLNTSFKIDSVQEIFLNYTRRTDQLRTIQLDPLPRWYDFYNVVIGNPDLKNEITDKISLDYLLNFKNLTLSNQFYFYNTSDKIELISSLYQNGIIKNQYKNMGSEKTLGFELSAYWRLGRRFTISEKLDIIETRMNVLLDQASLKRSYRQWYSVTSANYNITPTTLIEANFSYYGPYLTAQSTIDQIYMAGLSFRQMFFNKKLTFTVTGRDVFGLYRKAEHIQVNEFNQNITTCNKFPIRFALTYKFNKFKRDERRVAKSPILE